MAGGRSYHDDFAGWYIADSQRFVSLFSVAPVAAVVLSMLGRNIAINSCRATRQNTFSPRLSSAFS